MTEKDDGTLVLRILRDIRAEQTQHRTLLLQTIELVRRMEQRLDARIIGVDGRLTSMQDDLELMM